MAAVRAICVRSAEVVSMARNRMSASVCSPPSGTNARDSEILADPEFAETTEEIPGGTSMCLPKRVGVTRDPKTRPRSGLR